MMMIALLCTVVQGAWAWDGSGTQADPYQISSADDWNALATAVEGGESYSGKYFKLTKNIDKVETMVGCSKDKAFAGHFYGNGKTLAAYYNTSEPYTAPFRYINGATITDLTVDGIIWTTAQFAGGLVAVANGNNVIADCRISVAMNSEVNGDGTHGGVVAFIDGGFTIIDNCLFDYWLLGSETTNCGGFVGWCKTNSGASVMLTNCFFNPAQVTMSGSGCKAFVRYSGANLVKMDRCYYTDHTFGLGQGESRKGFSTASILEDLGDGWTTSNGNAVPAMSVSNIACAYVTGIKLRYQYTGSPIDIDYTVTRADGKVLTKGTDYDAVITHNTVPTDPVTDQGYYKLTLTGKGEYSGTKIVTFNVENATDLASVTGNYVIQNGETVTGTLGSKVKISIADGATITLSGITIKGEDNEAYNWAGLTCLGDATIVLADDTENTVGRFYQYLPGIFIPENKTLTIEGSGTLNVCTSDNIHDKEGAAAIGGHKSADCGNIVIKGGIINAKANPWAPGIGCGYGKSGGYIRIEGGVVNATGGLSCGGIGSGYLGTNGPVTITKDAVVTAIAGDHGPYSIGRGTDSWNGKSKCGTVTIGCTLDADGKPVGGHVGEVKASPFTYFYYTVALDGNDGSGTMTTKEVDRGYDSNLTLADNLTREGYTFMGWVAENGGTKKFYPGGTKYSELDVEPHTTITLTAQWMKGSGTAEAPYEIATDGDWLTMAYYINGGDGTYNNKYYKLMDDISISETVNKGETPACMIGTSETNAFSGTFDAGGHTLTLDITDERDEHYCGPFRFINGATIKNLHVTGTIVKMKQKHVGGIAGKAYGTNTITNCRSSVDIQANTDGDGSHGGFIGDLRGGTTTLTGCIFDGKMRGPGGAKSRTTKWGGFMGWVADGKKAVFNTCVFAPKEVNVKDKKDSRTFARRDDGDDVTLTNSYYTETLGSAQGSQMYSVTSDEHVSIAVAKADTTYTVSGIASYNDGAFITLDGIIYSAVGKNVYLSLTQNGETPTGYTEDAFIATPGSKLTKPEGSDWYLLKMPNTNVIISLLPYKWAGQGYELSPYLIFNTNQWNTLASQVNSGKSTFSGRYFMLMADITVTETINSGDAVTMVGCSESNSFSGIFDGNGHTITVNYTDNTDKDFCAPFRYINGATIKNLHVAGTITKAKGKNAGGLVGKAKGNNTISSCRSSVDILFNKNGDVSSGGFIGELRDGGTTNMTNCLFDGKLRGEESYRWGGFVGWVASGNTVNFTNCLFAPAESSFDMIDANDNSKTFARKDGTVTLTNCYFKTLLLDSQGATYAIGYENDVLLACLGDGWQISSSEVVPIMGIYSFDGEGTQASPYIIASADDWNGLVTNVAQDIIYSSKCFQLAANITVNRMIGDEFIPFRGTFDGAGHKLTFNHTTTGKVAAPFRCVDGATVENLHVSGTINTSSNYTAGLMGYVTGETTIRNCRSSVTINATDESQMIGSFIACIDAGTTTITGCLFDGNLQFYKEQTSPNYSGGFVGRVFSPASLQVNDCLFSPASVTNFREKGGTFAYFSEALSEDCSFNNSYYTQTLGEAQGKQARSITADTDIDMDIYGTVTEYNVSGITGYLAGILYNDVIYAGNEDEVRLNLDCEQTGYTLTGYEASAGTLSGNGNRYTLVMPDASVTISAVMTKNMLALIDGEDDTETIEKYDGLIADVTYDRVLSAIDNGDGTWSPRCYTMCLPYDINFYEKAESGQVNIYRLKYIDGDSKQFVFTNDFPYATGGMAWLVVVNYGSVKLDADGVKIIAQPLDSELTWIVDNQDFVDESREPKVVGYWTGTYRRIYDDEAEPLNIYGMQSDGRWEKYRVTSHGAKWCWIGTYRAFFQAKESLGVDTFKPMFTFTGAGEDDETGKVEEFPVINFEGDVVNGEETGINPVIRTIEANGSNRYFDMQGRQINGKPTNKGIYINNGKKVAIK